jgi:hypothetical protein
MTEPIEHELIRSVACVDIKVVKTEKQPTSADDWALGDMLRYFHFERGELHFYADSVRGL